ncbi:MAG: hypothetical protein MJE68_04130, partial [Proteobacteria bacterium]|nr:hypothetical protein [Pseudomonadota bacterium]
IPTSANSKTGGKESLVKSVTPTKIPSPILSQSKTLTQLLNEEDDLELVYSPELQEQLQGNLHLYLSMIEEQKQLDQLALEKAEQERLEKQRQKEKENYELEQQRIAEEEARLIQEEKLRAEKERLIVEGERLRLQAQQEAIEKQKKAEQERIEKEHQERLRQQRLAEQALSQLKQKEKETLEHFKRKSVTPEPVQNDPQIEAEISKLRKEVEASKSQKSKENSTAIAVAAALSKYPSMESLDERPREKLTTPLRKYYEEKEKILTEKLTVAENVYFEKESFETAFEQGLQLRTEYDTLKRELERKRRICFQMLILPSQEEFKYPTPPSVKTPTSGEWGSDKETYYKRKEEELLEIDKERYSIYLKKYAQTRTKEEEEMCKAEAIAHEKIVEVLHSKIRNALSNREKRTDTPVSSVRGSKRRGSENSKQNEYLELTNEIETPQVLEETRQRLQDMIAKGVVTPVDPTPTQKRVDAHIRQNLENLGMTAYGPESETGQQDYEEKKSRKTTPVLQSPLPQRQKIERKYVKPIGENTIPFQYSKELGRNGGIERPTSTEARESQDSAIKTTRDFFNGQKSSPKGEAIETPVGEPQRELTWDALDESIGMEQTIRRQNIPDSGPNRNGK